MGKLGDRRSLSPLEGLQDPELLMFMIETVLGVFMGTDEHGEPVHKQIVFLGVDDGALMLFGGVEVVVGDTIEMLGASTGSQPAPRSHCCRRDPVSMTC